jgi:hypothetical protein
MEEIAGAHLQPFLVNMPCIIIGKQVVKTLQAEKCSTYTIKGAKDRSFLSFE